MSSFWIVVLVVLGLWELLWKALAMWRAARDNQRGWYVALLVINTAGILPIAYLLSKRGTR